eukprot:5786515-Amphidinium_carterae.1
MARMAISLRLGTLRRRAHLQYMMILLIHPCMSKIRGVRICNHMGLTYMPWHGYQVQYTKDNSCATTLT